jgi:DNA-binding NarL/FixJ family response regulator
MIADALPVIDDEPQFRECVASTLVGEGYLVASASNAIGERRCLTLSGYSTVLSDVAMPGDPGIGLLEELTPRSRDVVAAMVTACDDRTLTDAAMALGAFGYVVKPFRISELLVSVSAAPNADGSTGSTRSNGGCDTSTGATRNRRLETSMQPTNVHSRSRPRRVTCLIADDHRALLKLLGRALEENGVTVIGRVCDGAEALARIVSARPEIALLDLQMPGLSGIEVARKAAESAPDTAVLIYTGHGEPALVDEALNSGVRGLIQKDASLEELVRAVETVSAGGTYVDPVLSRNLIGHDRSQRSRALSKREREVLHLLADGLTYAELGKRLFLSPETVRSHVKTAVEKLGAESRTQAVAKAIRLGLIA